MSDFIGINDYLSHVDSDVLNQIINSDENILDSAENDAVSVITDMLSGLYATETEFSKTGELRHRNLLRWTLNLSVYFLYKKIPGDQVPERIIKDYDDTMSVLQKIGAGKLPTTLQKKSYDNQMPRTVFRLVSNQKRSH